MTHACRSLLGWGALFGILVFACGGVEAEDSTQDAAADSASGGTAGSGASGAGGSAGSAGAAAGAAGDGGSAGGGGSGVDASACQASYDLQHCLVVSNPTQTATFMVPKFLGDVNSDCRIKKLITKQPFEHANELLLFTVDLWGCNGQSASTFGPALGAKKLSAADAALLIDYYTERSVDALTLGPKAEQEMRDALACLALTAITNPSTTEHEHSACLPDGGTDAGSDAPNESSTDAPPEDASNADGGAPDAGQDAGANDAESDVVEGGTD